MRFCTAGVRATGEKTARLPDVSFTGRVVSIYREKINEKTHERRERDEERVLTDCAASADAQLAKAAEGHREGDDIRRDVPDDHDILRVGGNELVRHRVWLVRFFNLWRFWIVAVEYFGSDSQGCYEDSCHEWSSESVLGSG
jgi:hypothetical protein